MSEQSYLITPVIACGLCLVLAGVWLGMAIEKRNFEIRAVVAGHARYTVVDSRMEWTWNEPCIKE